MASEAAGPSVAAVVVTFNRKTMLLDCLRQLAVQTVPLAHLLIIDNASTDGTEAALRESGLLAQAHVVYHRLADNTGGAGGFHFGLDAALQTGADWIWCMDDDVAPAPDCLENLLSFADTSECIHPLVIYEDGTEFEWEHIFDPTTTQQVGLRNASFRAGKTWCAMHVACFEGMLVSRRVLQAVGPPVRDFFIYSDDNYFGFLAARHTNVIYVSPARMIKKIKPTRAASSFKIYYDLRNRFLLRAKIAEFVKMPRYGPVNFGCFMLFYTYALLRAAPSRHTLLAAWRAWHDGFRGLAGRRHY